MISAATDTSGNYSHCTIFDQLVQSSDDQDDIVGLLAYGIYEQRKRKWASDFFDEKKRFPSLENLADYDFHYRDEDLISLRQAAEAHFFEYSEAVKDQAIEELKLIALEGRLESELAALNKRTGYEHHIVGHVIGFVVLVIIAIFVKFAIDYEPSIKEYIGLSSHKVQIP